MQSTAATSYTRTAKFLHWLIAIAIIGMVIFGWCLDFFPQGEPRFAAMQLHKSIGITILTLSLFRLLWRLMHRAPPLPATMPKWEQHAAHFGHFLLYCAMIGMPLTGWLMASTSTHNVPTLLYGLVTLPPIPVAPESKEAANHLGHTLHGFGGYAVAVLVVGHVAAAWKHHLIARDDILTRMAPNCFVPFLNRLRNIK